MKIPPLIGDIGLITINTTSHLPITFSEVKMEVLDQSPNLQVTIEPTVRTGFAPKDTANWFIKFKPKTEGILVFGRIVLHLDDKLKVFSPHYRFEMKEQVSKLSDGSFTSKPKIVSDFPDNLDLLASCGICKQSYNASDRVSFCDLCGSLFHQVHLQEWLKGHQTCPNCRQTIRISESDNTYEQLVIKRLKRLESEIQTLKSILTGFERFSGEDPLTMTESR